MNQVSFPAGYTIFTEGDPGEELYLIESGNVKIGRTGTRRLRSTRVDNHRIQNRQNPRSRPSRAPREMKCPRKAEDAMVWDT
ncbi:cyclic nucleotide-binding domain-containing protein [Mycolicibacterium setense]|uniref:cyclic nucleotide-binding domain-containing protein n=1 Tax=Mycolicibacterium setense TaxID=431269 RepID=UPI0009E30E0E|nr:cyclic nucleotide-binding domain-containing protein [Mycolicibacterium setense]